MSETSGLTSSVDALSEAAPSPVSFLLPAENLRALVTSYYFVRTKVPIADKLHPEWGNIRFAVEGSWGQGGSNDAQLPRRSGLFGPTDRSSNFASSAGLLLGVGLTPLGWVQLVREDASIYANRIVELGDLLGLAGDKLADALTGDVSDLVRAARLDTVLAERAETAPPRDQSMDIVQLVLAAGNANNVRQFAAETGLSERTLYRVCSSCFGFGPKRLLKRQRFLRTLDLVRDDLDGQLKQYSGDEYYDQAHFIRDFHAFMDTTPKAYFDSPREVMRRAARERRRIIGGSFQALHE